jgi:small subunit ribosomal protein S9
MLDSEIDMDTGIARVQWDRLYPHLNQEGRNLLRYIDERREWTRQHLLPFIDLDVANPDLSSIPADEEGYEEKKKTREKLQAEYDALVPKVKVWREMENLRVPKRELYELERQKIEDTLTPEEKKDVVGIEVAARDAIYTRRYEALTKFILDSQNPYLDDFLQSNITKTEVMEKLPTELNDADRQLVSDIYDDLNEPVTPEDMTAYIKRRNDDILLEFMHRYDDNMDTGKDYDALFGEQVELTIDWSQFTHRNLYEKVLNGDVLDSDGEDPRDPEEVEAYNLANKYCIEEVNFLGQLREDHRHSLSKRNPSLSQLRVDDDGREYYSFTAANTKPVNPFISQEATGYVEETSRAVRSVKSGGSGMKFSDSEASDSNSGASDSDSRYKEETQRAVRAVKSDILNTDDEGSSSGHDQSSGETSRKTKQQAKKDKKVKGGPLDRFFFSRDDLKDPRQGVLASFLGDFYDSVAKVNDAEGDTKLARKYFSYDDRKKRMSEAESSVKEDMLFRDISKEAQIQLGMNPRMLDHIEDVVDSGSEEVEARAEMAQYNPEMHQFIYGAYQGEHERFMEEMESFVDELDDYKRVLMQRGAQMGRGGLYDPRSMTINVERKYIPDALLSKYDEMQRIIKSLKVFTECIAIVEHNLQIRAQKMQSAYRKRVDLYEGSEGNAKKLNDAFIHTAEMNDFIQNVIMYRHLRLFLLAPYQAADIYDEVVTTLRGEGITETSAPLSVIAALVDGEYLRRDFKIRGDPKDKTRFEQWKDQVEYKNTEDFRDDGAHMDMESKLVDTTIHNGIVNVGLKLSNAQRSIDQYLAAAKSRKDYIRRELNVVKFYLTHSFHTVHHTVKERDVETWDEVYMETRDNSTRYKRRRTDIGVPDADDDETEVLNDGWIYDPSYDVSETVKEGASEQNDFAAWQERVGKEELLGREEAQKTEFLIYRDEMEAAVKTHSDYWLVKDYPLDEQLAMLGINIKYYEREEENWNLPTIDPSSHFLRDLAREENKSLEEMDFHVYDWLPRDGKHVDGVRTNLDVVYNGESSFAFRDPWVTGSEYRNFADTDVAGRSSFESTPGNVEYEQKKAFFDACAAEIDKRLRLKDKPKELRDDRALKKRLEMLMKTRNAKTGGQKKSVNYEGTSHGHGGRKEAHCKVIMRPVYPTIPRLIRHPVMETIEDLDGNPKVVEVGSTGQDINNCLGLIPLPEDVEPAYERTVAELRFKPSPVDGFDSIESLAEEEKRLRNFDRTCPLKPLHLRETYLDMDLTPIQGDAFLRSEEDQHFHIQFSDLDRKKEVRSGGLITINGQPLSEYFPSGIDRFDVMAPLIYTGVTGNFDIEVQVSGGGCTGQAQAIRLGITRALLKQYPHFKKTLRVRGFVTRDPRAVERKKPGRHKARRGFQWVKR